MNSDQVELYLNNLKLVSFVYSKKIWKSKFIFRWQDEILGEGRLGLALAASKWDPTTNVKFSTFAIRYIYWSMVGWIRSNYDSKGEVSLELLAKKDEQEPLNLLDILIKDSVSEEDNILQDMEDKYLISLIKEIIITLKPEELYILKNKVNGMSFQDIADLLKYNTELNPKKSIYSRQLVKRHYDYAVNTIKASLYLFKNDLNVPRLKYYGGDEDRFKKDFRSYLKRIFSNRKRLASNIDKYTLKPYEVKDIQEHKDINKHYLGSLNHLSFYFYEGDKGNPHIHFENKENGEKGCIRLDNYYYEDHGPYKGRLTKDEARKFNAWIEQDLRYPTFVNMWNKYNGGNCPIIKKPEYNKYLCKSKGAHSKKNVVSNIST